MRLDHSRDRSVGRSDNGGVRLLRIEEHDRDFTYCYSLNEIKDVCKKLRIHPRDLFCEEPAIAISIEDFVERIKALCDEKKLSIEQFENIAGWKLASSLTNPPIALDEWNLDCLIDLSRELRIDWRRVITGL
jgi:hypothetical protein